MVTPKVSWQDFRTMNASEYAEALEALGLNTASAGRFLGVSTRTSHRYLNDEAEIPEAQALLLRTFIAKRITPKVPSWRADRNKHW